MKKPENPHAFPSTYIPNEGHYEPGISLRDYFAAKALPVAIEMAREYYQNPETWDAEAYANQAYKIADAMLTERAKNQEHMKLNLYD